METTNERLTRYCREYAQEMWPTLTYRDPREDELIVIEVRSDGYANAHVEGEHNSNGICHFDSARECGERFAASEYVECTDMRE